MPFTSCITAGVMAGTAACGIGRSVSGREKLVIGATGKGSDTGFLDREDDLLRTSRPDKLPFNGESPSASLSGLDPHPTFTTLSLGRTSLRFLPRGSSWV